MTQVSINCISFADFRQMVYIWACDQILHPKQNTQIRTPASLIPSEMCFPLYELYNLTSTNANTWSRSFPEAIVMHIQMSTLSSQLSILTLVSLSIQPSPWVNGTALHQACQPGSLDFLSSVLFSHSPYPTPKQICSC